MIKTLSLLFCTFFMFGQAYALPLQAALSGNNITALLDGPSTHLARLDLIENANTSLYFSTFSISNDEAGKELKALLCEKAKSGVEVRMMIDHRQSKGYYETSRALKKCGAHVLNFRPGSRLFAMHEKVLIADGTRAILGGSGVSRKYKIHSFFSDHEYFLKKHHRKSGWYDKDYLVEGPAACGLHYNYQRNFKHMVSQWAFYDHEVWWYGEDNYRDLMPKFYGLKKFNPCVSVEKVGNTRALGIIGNPYKRKQRPILDAHIDAIHAAIKNEVKEFQLYAPYFVPHKKWTQAVAKALDAGIKVHVITNSVESNDEGERIGRVLFLAMKIRIKNLLAKGMQVHLWQKNSTLHRKGGSYGSWLFFGSDNLDVRAQEWQTESVIFTTDQNLISEHDNEYQRDLEHTKLMTADVLDQIVGSASKLEKFVASKIIDLL
jgi:cardiolipin synthase